MKYKMILIALAAALIQFFTVLLGASPVKGADETGSVVVHVTGLKNDKGDVRFAIYNSSDSYLADKGGGCDHAYKKDKVEIKNAESTCRFSDLPFGSYGVKFFHDEDDSGKFYTGMFGLPKVQYGFSNNARAHLGMPSFDKLQFDLKSHQLQLELRAQ